MENSENIRPEDLAYAEDLQPDVHRWASERFYSSGREFFKLSECKDANAKFMQIHSQYLHLACRILVNKGVFSVDDKARVPYYQILEPLPKEITEDVEDLKADLPAQSAKVDKKRSREAEHAPKEKKPKAISNNCSAYKSQESNNRTFGGGGFVIRDVVEEVEEEEEISRELISPMERLLGRHRDSGEIELEEFIKKAIVSLGHGKELVEEVLKIIENDNKIMISEGIIYIV